MNECGKRLMVDLAAASTVVAAFIDLLPHIAAALSVIWMAVRLYNEVMTAVYRRRRHK